MTETPPRTTRQYYDHFKYKGSTEHVIVETYGGTITHIFVITHTTIEVPHLQNEFPVDHQSHRLETWFTLEPVDPDADWSRGYDETNKLHYKALILVHNVLTNQSDEDLRAGKWHARMQQAWPPEIRLSDEAPY